MPANSDMVTIGNWMNLEYNLVVEKCKTLHAKRVSFLSLRTGCKTIK